MMNACIQRPVKFSAKPIFAQVTNPETTNTMMHDIMKAKTSGAKRDGIRMSVDQQFKGNDETQQYHQ